VRPFATTTEAASRPEMTRTPHEDLYQEAQDVLGAARTQDITVRALGGLGVRMLCPSAAHPPLERPYKDLDLAGLSEEREAIDALLVGLGYEPDETFNLLSGHARLFYRDRANARQLDVFLDRIEMCHALDLRRRLELHELTLTPTDLLLTKLQVIETNERDLKDSAALLADCDVDVGYVARTLASDWGWWRTVTEVLEKLARYVATLEFRGREGVLRKIETLQAGIEAEPKGRRWKLRARIGDRVRWYEIPEEDHATT
jgi:hypothetical protein